MPETLPPRLRREQRTVEVMIRMYCRDLHGGGPCPECRELMGYAHARVLRCPYGKGKPACSKCPIHCYRKERREQVRRVMRYSGPRMLLRHPLLGILHLADGLRRAKSPPGFHGSAGRPA